MNKLNKMLPDYFDNKDLGILPNRKIDTLVNRLFELNPYTMEQYPQLKPTMFTILNELNNEPLETTLGFHKDNGIPELVGTISVFFTLEK